MKEHHLQLNLAKTELLVLPATPTLQHDFTIQLGSSTITPSTSCLLLSTSTSTSFLSQKSWCNLWWSADLQRAHCKDCWILQVCTTQHQKDQNPFWPSMLHNFLSRPLSSLDCNALLAGLPSNTIKPLQMIQNAAARLVFNEPKRAHVTPLFISLHWLPVAARIKFKTLMLAYRTTTVSAPSYFHSLLRIYIPSRSPAYFHSLSQIYIPFRSLRSASERRLVVTSQWGSKSLSRTFSFTVPGRWNDLPTPHLERWIPVNLQETTENSSLSTLLDLKKTKKKHLSKSSSFSPSLASLYLFEQCLRLGVTSTSSVCLPLQDESFYVFPNCKSLWIKASAKWLNVNVNILKIYTVWVCFYIYIINIHSKNIYYLNKTFILDAINRD